MTKTAMGIEQAAPDSIPLVEIFDSIEGEGLQAGTPMTFVRFSHCNLACGFCDTPYNRVHLRVGADELVELLKHRDPRWIKFTGGEPCIQSNLAHVARCMQSLGKSTCIETNGTLWNPGLLNMDYVVISPKFYHSPGNLLLDKDFFDSEIGVRYWSGQVAVGELRYCIPAKHTKEDLRRITQHPLINWGQDFAEEVPTISLRRPTILVSPEFSDVIPLGEGWESGEGHPSCNGVINPVSLNACLRYVHSMVENDWDVDVRLSLQTHKFMGVR